jgi:hypothetical protein
MKANCILEDLLRHATNFCIDYRFIITRQIALELVYLHYESHIILRNINPIIILLFITPEGVIANFENINLTTNYHLTTDVVSVYTAPEQRPENRHSWLALFENLIFAFEPHLYTY